MVNTCVVFGCSFSYSRSKKKKEGIGISIHRFPVREDLRESWIKAIRRQNWHPTPASGVCSQHFHPDDLDLTGQTRRLKEDAIPSIFPAYPAYLQNQMKNQRKPRMPWNVIVESKSNVSSVQQVSDSDSAALSLDSRPNSPEQLTPCKRKLMEELNKLKEELCCARKKIKVLQQKVRRCERKIKTDQEIIDSLMQENLILENNVEILESSFPSDECCLLDRARKSSQANKVVHSGVV